MCSPVLVVLARAPSAAPPSASAGATRERHQCNQGGRSRACVDAVGGDFDFGDAAEGEQKLYEVLGWLFGGLFHDVGNRVGNRGLEHDALGLQAGEVHTHELSGLECRAHMKIVPPRAVKCKPSAMTPGAEDQQSILKNASARV